jgi:hypothetical protein
LNPVFIMLHGASHGGHVSDETLRGRNSRRVALRTLRSQVQDLVHRLVRTKVGKFRFHLRAHVHCPLKSMIHRQKKGKQRVGLLGERTICFSGVETYGRGWMVRRFHALTTCAKPSSLCVHPGLLASLTFILCGKHSSRTRPSSMQLSLTSSFVRLLCAGCCCDGRLNDGLMLRPRTSRKGDANMNSSRKWPMPIIILGRLVDDSFG